MAYAGNFTSDGSLRCAIGSIGLPSGAAIEAKQLPDNHQVTVSNASIPVTGTFFPATQPISAISLPLPAGAATAAGQLPDNHQVNISNASLAITAATLPLPSGAATAAGQLPDNHQVSVSNFPATQPVSAVALPLPAGAATAVNQLPDNHQVTVSNFPATQAISAVSLPLPSGAATAAGQLPDNHQVTVSNPGSGDIPCDTATRDAFSRIRVSNPQTIFQTQASYDLDAVDMEAGSTGTGVTPTFDSTIRAVTLSCGAGSGSSFYQSYEYIPYQPGKSQLAFITFTLGTAVAGAVKDVGYFDSENGVFLRQNGVSGLEIILRSSVSGGVVDQTISQANWNIDPLDGTGPSGLTLDVANAQILVIDLQFLGMGRVRVAFDIDGCIKPVHYFLNANNITTPYMQTATLPVQALMTSTAVADMLFKCASVISEGGVDNKPSLLTATPEVTATMANGTLTHFISLRPKTTFNGITNRTLGLLNALNILITNNNEMQYLIVYGAVFSVAPTWNDVNGTFSSFEYGTGGTFSNFTGGILLENQYANSSGSFKGVIDNSFQSQLPITLDRAGANRALGTVTVIAQGIGGNAAIRGSLQFSEYR